MNLENYQGNAVINYTYSETPFTRIIEHEQIEFSGSSKTIIAREYPKTRMKGEEAYFSLNDEKILNYLKNIRNWQKKKIK